jgi:hypothetical protein
MENGGHVQMDKPDSASCICESKGRLFGPQGFQKREEEGLTLRVLSKVKEKPPTERSFSFICCFSELKGKDNNNENEMEGKDRKKEGRKETNSVVGITFLCWKE